jgi:hypothetical protein
MSARPSIYVSRKRPAPGGKSPNAHFPQLTTEIRIFAPAVTPASVLCFELWEAMGSAADKIRTTWPGPALSRSMRVVESELGDYGLAVPIDWRASGFFVPEESPS